MYNSITIVKVRKSVLNFTNVFMYLDTINACNYCPCEEGYYSEWYLYFNLYVF